MAMSRQRSRGSKLWATAVFVLGLVPVLIVALAEPSPAQQEPQKQKSKNSVATEKAAVEKAPSTEQNAGKSAVQKDKKKKAPPPNPLSKFIKNLFPNRPAAAPKKKKAAAKGKTARPVPAGNDKQEERTAPVSVGAERDHIDSRAPQNSLIAKKFRRAAAKIEEQNWDQALELLNNLLDPTDAHGRRSAHVDALIRMEDGRLASVQAETARLLGRLPQEYLERYQRQQSPKADVLFDEALEQNDLQGIVSVATRFFHTDPGKRAANHLGTHHFDRGEFGMAARWFTQLIDAHAEVTQDPKWRMKVAFALRQTGRNSEAEALLKSLSSSERLNRLQLGGTEIEPESWLQKTEISQSNSRQYDDWTLFLGSSSRTGTSTGGEPLLLPRWSSAATHSSSLLDQIRILTEDLGDMGRVAIPAMFPLTVDGKVIFRTLRGVRVVDAETGDELWETAEGVSPERILTGQPPADTAMIDGPFRMRGQIWGGALALQRFNTGNSADFRSLTSLLFRDGTYGIISSDGEQLFVIEDHAVLSGRTSSYDRRRQIQRNDLYRRSWLSNRITSYDLKSGRPIWDVGGREMNEPFDPPLAGTYFFGAPVVDGTELFVVGEKENEIRLFALDPQLGLPLWSQLIAYSDASIDQDVGRRWFTSQVSVGNGVIVCPTTVGWLVAVDRLKQTILWAHRYTKPEGQRQRRNSQNTTYVQPHQLNHRWTPSAPIIVGNRVVYASSEEQMFECLNLFDGSRVWKKSKGNSLYLAGVFDQHVVVVGTRSIAAYSLESGASAWTVGFSSDEGAPAGVGVAVGETYYLPLKSGQLWSINLQTGKVLAKLQVRDQAEPLGNLAMYRGMLISQGPAGVTAYEQRETVENEILRGKSASPIDYRAMLLEADVHVLNRDHQQALTALHQIPDGALHSGLADAHRSKLIESLSAIVRSDFQNFDAEMAELSRVAETTDEKNSVRRLAAERLDERQQFEEAFHLYWELAALENDEDIVRGDNSEIVTSSQHWFAGKLADLWSRMPPESRDRLNEKIQDAAVKRSQDDTVQQRQFVLQFGFHPASLPILWDLIEQHVAEGRFLQAENLLLKLSKRSDSQVASRALNRLVQLLSESGLKADAAYYQQDLQRRFPDAANALATKESTNTDRPGGSTDHAGILPQPTWGNVDLEFEISGTGYHSSRVHELRVENTRLPFYQQYRLQIEQSHQQLLIVDASNEAIYWMAPLRSTSGRTHHSHISVAAAAHQLMLVHQGMLYCLSPVDRSVLWTRSIEMSGQRAVRYRNSGRSTKSGFFPNDRVKSQHSLNHQAAQNGPLAVANNNYVCVYGRRNFSVLDAMTGEVLWKHDGIAKETKVFGTDDTIYVLPPSRSKAVALRALDGKKIEVADIPRLISNSIATIGSGFVRLDANLRKEKMALSLVVPTEDRVEWEIEIPRNVKLAVLGDGQLAMLDQKNDLQLIDFESGRIKPFFCNISATAMRKASGLIAVTDPQTLYLVLSNRGNSGRYGAQRLDSIPVNGELYAFDRSTGKQIWHQSVSGKNLIRTHLKHSPVLVLYSQQNRNEDKVYYQTMSLLALDKKTGRTLADVNQPSYSGFQTFNINMADRYLEFRSYDRRYRLVAIDRLAENRPVSAEKPQDEIQPAEQ